MWDAHLLFGTSEADATSPQPVAEGQAQQHADQGFWYQGHLVRRISSAARIWAAAAPWTWTAAAPWIWAAAVPRIWAAAPPRASSCTRSTSWICVARCDWADPCLSDFREIKDRFLQQASPFDSPSHLPAAAPPAERTHQAAVPIFHPSALAVLGQCIPAAWDFSFLRPWLLACWKMSLMDDQHKPPEELEGWRGKKCWALLLTLIGSIYVFVFLALIGSNINSLKRLTD